MLAFVDTMVLIWWIRKDATDGQEEMLDRARWLMEKLEQGGADVAISTITEAEFLRGAAAEQRDEQSRILHQFFLVKPFDTNAAQTLSREFARDFSVAEYSKQRTALKADMMLVATAAAAGVDVFYSHDAECRKLAEKAGIRAQDLPTMQNGLFDDGNVSSADEGDG